MSIARRLALGVQVMHASGLLAHATTSELTAHFERELAKSSLADSLEELKAMRGYGEGVLHSIASTRGQIASLCMACGDVYRVVDAEGAGGGLSHGVCHRRECQPGFRGAEPAREETI